MQDGNCILQHHLEQLPEGFVVYRGSEITQPWPFNMNCKLGEEIEKFLSKFEGQVI